MENTQVVLVRIELTNRDPRALDREMRYAKENAAKVCDALRSQGSVTIYTEDDKIERSVALRGHTTLPPESLFEPEAAA